MSREFFSNPSWKAPGGRGLWQCGQSPFYVGLHAFLYILLMRIVVVSDGTRIPLIEYLIGPY